MEYKKIITLKDGRECCLRNAAEEDGASVWEIFMLTHDQTDWLLSYPDENSMDIEQESQFLKAQAESEDEIMIVAEVDGKMAGTASVCKVGRKEKVRRRAEFGISVDMDLWGLGIGRALTEACIECARKAGYAQLELDVVAENKSAVTLYESEGFVEYGRNPRGFCSRLTGWQELLLMRLELD